MTERFRKLPQITEILDREQRACREEQKVVVKQVANEVLEEYRQKIRQDETFDFTREEVFQEIDGRLANKEEFSLLPTINATGVVLHTNLGRAVLSPEALDHIKETACSYSNLEYNLTGGRRGSRYNHVVDLVRELTGAEDALLVNNNAAAVFLMLNTLVAGKEALVSRGELVEIGDGFRISEIMARSGARLVEVGATNRTHLYDYERALTEETAVIMKVHASNYRVIGFSESVSAPELKELAQERELPVIEDLGSGSLVDLTPYGLSHERTVADCIREGIDLVSFSCDKLLAGPQGGIICGRHDLIQKIKKNQLLRAFRVGKLSIAALEYTLLAYRNPESLAEKLPAMGMIMASSETLKKRADQLLKEIRQEVPGCPAQVVATSSMVGGGAYPAESLPSFGLRIAQENPEKLEAFLRNCRDHIICSVHDRALYMDVRTLLPGQSSIIAKRVGEYYAS